MKRMFFTIMLAVAVCVSSFATKRVAKGKTNSTFGNFTIEKADQPVMLNGKALDAFVITYDNFDTKVTVAIEKEGPCRKYYVLNKDLSVQYVRTQKYFGIQRLDKTLETEGYQTDLNSMNRRQYFYQRVLAGSVYGDRGNSILIAAYYPFLVTN
jgi:hypothetical protein